VGDRKPVLCWTWSKREAQGYFLPLDEIFAALRNPERIGSMVLQIIARQESPDFGLRPS